MVYTYTPHGVCSQKISFEIDDTGCMKNVKFVGGCNGNAQGIGHLAEGMKAEELVQRVKGIRCGFKNTSCPDQLARAVEEVLKEN